MAHAGLSTSKSVRVHDGSATGPAYRAMGFWSPTLTAFYHSKHCTLPSLAAGVGLASETNISAVVVSAMANKPSIEAG